MWGQCPICNKRKGGPVDHSLCSKKLQEAALERLAKPSIGRSGVPRVGQSGAQVTVEQKHRADLRKVGKMYGKGKNGEYWKKFD